MVAGARRWGETTKTTCGRRRASGAGRKVWRDLSHLRAATIVSPSERRRALPPVITAVTALVRGNWSPDRTAILIMDMV